jgi:hypothetical protein
VRGKLPERLVRVMNQKPGVDLKRRTITATVATRKLARDGGILLPEGLVVRSYETNPVVLAMHGMGCDRNSAVIGACTGMTISARDLVAETQFADTELGREYFYLYGGNEAGEVYMRAWSFGWDPLETRWISLEEARTLLGSDWDEELVPNWVRRDGSVWVCDKGEMLEYSAVSIGADRDALSRAMKQGNRAAAIVATEMDLMKAQRTIDELRVYEALREKVERLEKELLAIRSKGEAAAADGDTACLIEALGEISRKTKPQQEEVTL